MNVFLNEWKENWFVKFEVLSSIFFKLVSHNLLWSKLPLK